MKKQRVKAILSVILCVTLLLSQPITAVYAEDLLITDNSGTTVMEDGTEEGVVTGDGPASGDPEGGSPAGGSPGEGEEEDDEDQQLTVFEIVRNVVQNNPLTAALISFIALGILGLAGYRRYKKHRGDM